MLTTTCITLTPEERAVLQQRLTDAEKAYHTLAMGQQARVIVDQNGERVEFATAQKGVLANYILSLKAQLGMFSPACGGLPMRPAGFLF